MNEIEARRMSQARARLLAVAPFYGAPSLRLQLRENLKIDTLCTDGTHIDYNPNYTSKHSVGELMFDVAHETGHCLLLHPYRIGNRNLDLANVAGDYCINALLVDGKFEMPAGLLLDRKYDGMSMEQVYATLYREREQERERNKNRNGGDPGPSDDSDESESDEDDDDEQQSQGGSAGNEPSDDDESDDDEGQEQSGSGSDDADDDEDADESDEPGEGESDEDNESESGHQHFVPAPQPSEPGEDDEAEAIEGQESASDRPLTAEDWQRIAEQAVMIQRKAGNLPAGADLAVGRARQSEVDWVAALKEFIVNTVPTGQDWTHPDRRFVADGTYMPGTVRENTPPLGVPIDASGSCISFLPRFLTEMNAIANEVRPERIDVVSFDSTVTNVDSFEADEEITFDPKGGGGTYFNPVLVDWLNEKMDEGNPPAALVFFTDLESADIPLEPEIPVLWVVPEWVRRDPPFGSIVRIPVHE